VRDGFRGRGIGRELINAMEQVSREMGIKKIRTHCHRSPGFWEKIGYSLMGKEYEKIIAD